MVPSTALGVVPAIRRISHLPVMVDPSHSGGTSYMVTPLARAGVAVGADGLIVEVHNQPELALSDGAQFLPPTQWSTDFSDASGWAQRSQWPTLQFPEPRRRWQSGCLRSGGGGPLVCDVRWDTLRGADGDSVVQRRHGVGCVAQLLLHDSVRRHRWERRTRRVWSRLVTTRRARLSRAAPAAHLDSRRPSH